MAVNNTIHQLEFDIREYVYNPVPATLKVKLGVFELFEENVFE
jgi:hypothetical protein